MRQRENPMSPIARLARLLRPWLPMLVALALIAAVWGGVRVYRQLSYARQMTCAAFGQQNRTFAWELSKLTQQLDQWSPDAGDAAPIDRAIGQINLLMDVWPALSSLEQAVFTWQKPLTSYGSALHDALWSTSTGLRKVSEHTHFGIAFDVDAGFVQAVAGQFHALSETLRSTTFGVRADHWRELSFPEAKRQGILGRTTEIRDLCWSYEHEAALAKGARQAKIAATEAVEAARARAPEWAATVEAGTKEIINWWAGIHYWQISFGDSARQASFTALVDAQSGEILSWGANRGSDPTEAIIAIEDAEAAARAYLEANRPGEYVLGGWRAGNGWLAFTWFPRAGGVTYYSYPLYVTVSGHDGEVIGCGSIAAVPIPGPDSARPNPTPLSMRCKAEVGSLLGSSLTGISEGWGMWHLSSGVRRLAWTVTVRTTAEYRKSWEDVPVQNGDGTLRMSAGPTHIVGFVDAETGEWLGRRHLWLSGDEPTEYSPHGSTRR